MSRFAEFKHWPKSAICFGLVASSILFASLVAGGTQTLAGAAPLPSGGFAGDVACASCHRAQAETYRQTAHARTSSVPSLASVHGDFTTGRNAFHTTNPNLYFLMEAAEGGLVQKAELRTPSGEVMERTERFDVVIGSGRKGQTFLFWDGAQLFQLPISYWTELGEWVNSPGYVDGVANFERPIGPRCLECHATSYTSLAPPENAYDRAGLVLGISCERCHGEGSEHVRRYRSATPPVSPADGAIVHPARLPRDRQVDICALCHAGIGTSLAPPGSFVAGQELAHYLAVSKGDGEAHIDVHGSQVQLLARSRCFRASATMTCTTCHNVHQPQRNLETFATACTSCHAVSACGKFKELGHRIDRQCVVCHMPLEETAQIVISGIDGRSLQPKVRNHDIAIYPGMNLPVTPTGGAR